MPEENDTSSKPNLENLEMHMPETGNTLPTEEPGRTMNSGPIIIILVVLLILILGGLFWWYTQLPQNSDVAIDFSRPTPEENNEPESSTAEAQTDALRSLSTSDELGPIEADLAGTNVNALEREIIAIEAELENAAIE